MIKRDWTNRARKPLHLFFKTLKEGLIELSKEVKPWISQVEVKTEQKLKGTELEEKKIIIRKKNYYLVLT